MPLGACDRCYLKKSKCDFDQVFQRCSHCHREGYVCTFNRRPRRMGRPPPARNFPTGHCGVLALSAIKPEPEHERPVELSTLSTHPAYPWLPRPGRSVVMDVLQNGDTFYTVHQHFMIGPSFRASFQRAVLHVTSYGGDALVRAYQAVLGLWDTERCQIRAAHEVDMSSGIDCLKLLQEAKVTRAQDAAGLLMMAQVLLIYHIGTMGTSAHSIMRSALLMASPFYEDLLNQPRLDPITITPILVDTIEALVRRELPVIRLPHSLGRVIVDRTAGVCWSLLPLLHQLCEKSVAARQRKDADLERSEEDDFTDIEHKIRSWHPPPPLESLPSCTSLEAAAMLVQARVYRVTALLIIHRLRYPLDVKDDEAFELAESILGALTTFLDWVPDNIYIQFGFPLLVAKLEVREQGNNIINHRMVFGTNPQHASVVRQFIDFAWSARQGGFNGLWFELVGSSSVPIVP